MDAEEDSGIAGVRFTRSAGPEPGEWMTRCPHPPGEVSILFRARDYVTRDDFEVGECGRCGWVVTLPQPVPEQMARYYPVQYYHQAGTGRFPSPIEKAQQWLYGRRAREIEELAGGRPGRVLDIGCGPGLLLEAFRRRGWDVEGIERTDSSAAHAREILGIPVHVGDPGSWPWPDDHFDAVVMWHALEHVPGPGEVLDGIERLVRPGGLVTIGVPNFASPEARLTRGGWFHLDVPRHLTHLTTGTLREALAERGMAVRRTSFFVPEYDLFSFVQSAENALGLPHNLLYDVLRHEAARLLEKPPGLGQRLLSVALAFPLGLAGLPVTALLGATGRGSSVTVHAVKAG